MPMSCDLNSHLMWVDENIVYGWGILLIAGLIWVTYLGFISQKAAS